MGHRAVTMRVVIGRGRVNYRKHHAGAVPRSIAMLSLIFRAEGVVELRRIELLTSAVRLQRSPI